LPRRNQLHAIALARTPEQWNDRQLERSDRHPAVANSLNNLAVLRYHQNCFAEAEPLLLPALAIRQQVLGEAHPEAWRICGKP
jgi:Tetratricopeptide repeat